MNTKNKELIDQTINEYCICINKYMQRNRPELAKRQMDEFWGFIRALYLSDQIDESERDMHNAKFPPMRT